MAYEPTDSDTAVLEGVLTDEPRLGATTMPTCVQALTQRCRAAWWACDFSLPPPEGLYPPQVQRAYEARLARYVDEIVVTLKAPPRAWAEQQAWQTWVLGETSDLLQTLLGCTERQLAALQLPTLVAAAVQFAQVAHAFDPALRPSDIAQAGRNVLTGYLLQLLLNRPLQLTPALFAYSLLYPYTDNYLDDAALPRAAKRAFYQRFAARLAGETLPPATPAEATIFHLVGMIEAQYDRAQFPQVFASLLAIHRAQGRSLQLIGAAVSPYEHDVLGLTFEKGGTSVLADGYLVAGTLTPAQVAFMFGLGAFLQLADDLEDVAADQRAGQQTVFSQTAGHWPLDAVINRTLHFGTQMLRPATDCATAPGQALGQFMQHHGALPLIQAAGQVGRWCSRPYLHALEQRTPCRFAFGRQQRRKLVGPFRSLPGWLEALAQARPPAALVFPQEGGGEED